MSTNKHGWDQRESGPADADHTVLLLPGGLCTLEMAALGVFSGPVVLLSPAFSREDEFKELVVLDRLGRVPGLAQLGWAAMLKTIGRAMKGVPGPPSISGRCRPQRPFKRSRPS